MQTAQVRRQRSRIPSCLVAPCEHAAQLLAPPSSAHPLPTHPNCVVCVPPNPPSALLRAALALALAQHPQPAIQAGASSATPFRSATTPHLQVHDGEEVWEVEVAPLYVAVVDTACGADFLEQARSALLAALEAMPPAALFGLISVAEEVGRKRGRKAEMGSGLCLLHGEVDGVVWCSCGRGKAKPSTGAVGVP